MAPTWARPGLFITALRTTEPSRTNNQEKTNHFPTISTAKESTMADTEKRMMQHRKNRKKLSTVHRCFEKEWKLERKCLS